MRWRRSGAALVASCALVSACAAPSDGGGPLRSGPPWPMTSLVASTHSTATAPAGQQRSASSSNTTVAATASGTPTSDPARAAGRSATGRTSVELTSGTAAGTTSTAGTAGAAGAASPPRTVTILGSGDVLLHPPLWAQAAADAAAAGETGYDFGPLYSNVATDVRAADVAICELETPVASPSGPFSGWPRFNVPPQVLSTLADIGYDSCTTASNHTLDQGESGVIRTLDALDAAGLAHTGSARTGAEFDTPLILTTENGVRVGQLAYTFSFNGLHRPAGKEWMANLIDVPAILAAARRTRAAGADIVVLSLHWGIEYHHLASDTQRREAETLLASTDIDLLLGSHAHVVQPMERLDGEWVVYGMGNQVARHADPIDSSREGIMPVITFTEVTDGTFRTSSAAIVPTWMQLKPALRLIGLPDALRDPALSDAEHAAYRDIVARISGYVDAYGATVPVAGIKGAPAVG